MGGTFSERLGTGTYSARWVNRSNLIELTASGILPCSNYRAQLEVRPERVVPPMWTLLFFTEDFCIRANRPFTKTVRMIGDPNSTKAITVFDAGGEHQVPVEAAREAQDSETAAKTADRFVVYSDIVGPGERPTGCFLVPEGWLVLAIYVARHGPAPKAECEAWIADNCAEGEAALRAGEIPWPLFRRA